MTGSPQRWRGEAFWPGTLHSETRLEQLACKQWLWEWKVTNLHSSGAHSKDTKTQSTHTPNGNSTKIAHLREQLTTFLETRQPCSRTALSLCESLSSASSIPSPHRAGHSRSRTRDSPFRIASLMLLPTWSGRSTTLNHSKVTSVGLGSSILALWSLSLTSRESLILLAGLRGTVPLHWAPCFTVSDQVLIPFRFLWSTLTICKFSPLVSTVFIFYGSMAKMHLGFRSCGYTCLQSENSFKFVVIVGLSQKYISFRVLWLQSVSFLKSCSKCRLTL